jgi:hypothetical protein
VAAQGLLLRASTIPLNGDPLAVTLTTPIGTVVTIVGEGLDTDEFKNLLTQVRPLDSDEWADLVDA